MIDYVASYARYRQTSRWRAIHNEINNGLYRCFFCGKKKQLEPHHISYARLGNEKLYEDLYPVCRECHLNKWYSCHYMLGRQLNKDEISLTRQLYRMGVLWGILRLHPARVIDNIWYLLTR